MINLNNKKNIWLTIIILIIIGGISSFLFINNKIQESNRTFINIFSVIGTVATILALTLTFIQFLSLTKIVSAARQEIANAAIQIQTTSLVSEISKGVKIINEIKKFLQDNKFEAAELRMQDIKPLVIQIKQNEALSSKAEPKLFRPAYSNFFIDIDNINNHLVDPVNNIIDVIILNTNLEQLSRCFLQIEGSLKTYNNE